MHCIRSLAEGEPIVFEELMAVKIDTKMAKKIKDYYDQDCARMLAEKLVSVEPSFDSAGYIEYVVSKIEPLEFSDRMDVYADAFEEYLSLPYKDVLALFTKILGPELETDTGMFNEGWWHWPLGRFVERHALEDYDASMVFIHRLTRSFTGEFAIRPLIRAHPKKTLQIMEKWSREDNVHVRRLASEGLRIKLPWATKMTEAADEFELFTQILTNLKDAPEKFVQKSVGNNLNDLMKEDPDKANKILEAWEADSPSDNTKWIVKHGRRSLKSAKK